MPFHWRMAKRAADAQTPGYCPVVRENELFIDMHSNLVEVPENRQLSQKEKVHLKKKKSRLDTTEERINAP